MPETIEIACQVIRETERAWLINDGTKEVWIACSQISDYIESPGLFGMRVTSIEIPVWLAEENGLV